MTKVDMDIVARCRAAYREISGVEWIELEQAADEIEKLREMVSIYETTDASRSFTDEQASRMYVLANK